MEMEPGKLFIGGISWDTNEDRLKEYFQTFGEVVEAVIMKDRTTGRARGFGFVVFADPAVAERVVKDKHMIDGRSVEAKKAVPRDDQQTPNRISGGSVQGSPGPNLEPGFGPNFEPAGNLVSNINYGRGLNAFQNGSPNRYGSPVGYGIGGGIGSVFNSMNRNSWGDGSLNNANSNNSAEFMGSGNGDTGLINALGNIGAIWGSSPVIGQDRGTGSAYSHENINFGNAESSFELGAVGQARNTRANMVPSPTSTYAAVDSGDDGSYGNFHSSGSVYGDTTWRLSSPDLEGPRSFSYDLRDAVSEVTPRDAVGYVGGYSVTDRSNRGLLPRKIII
ncbi:hypothetical protein POM88_019629 [Heracleum sosnowskyi]|uniref:RRM domain-containing protein n=1 Tax=Heracleum sosnowskyi TaxID=360622 RepID=A0AAD8IA10_9APIA|nr:hypothetical protein POM88_019629 [Heracleum sosnowskyi]